LTKRGLGRFSEIPLDPPLVKGERTPLLGRPFDRLRTGPSTRLRLRTEPGRSDRRVPNGRGAGALLSGHWLHRAMYYPLSYPLLEVLPFFRQRAPGPLPTHSTSLAFCRSLSTRRTISRLTPGQACSSSAKVNSPENAEMADSTNSVFAPRGLLICPTRSSNSR